jgi:hypothetical protein
LKISLCWPGHKKINEKRKRRIKGRKQSIKYGKEKEFKYRDEKVTEKEKVEEVERK